LVCSFWKPGTLNQADENADEEDEELEHREEIQMKKATVGGART